jgi:GNAT superfamily N-acetyltransferase
MSSILDKIARRFESEGPRAALRSLYDDAVVRVIDANREIVVMAIDFAHPKARPQPGEVARWPITMRALDDAGYDDIARMLATSERWRSDAVQSRRGTGAQALVAWEGDTPVGFMFYSTESHPDLEWLGIGMGPSEVYAYDGFVPAELRGRGPTMFRLAYQHLAARGYTKAHGFCYAVDKAAMFTYRMMGWQEARRIHEHRLLGKLAVVNGALYKLNRFDRARLAPLPGPVPDALGRLGAAIR